MESLYMMWFDDSAKKTPSAKIEEAVAAYRAHFGTSPNVALVHADEVCEAASVTVRAASYVRKANYWIGYEQ